MKKEGVIWTDERTNQQIERVWDDIKNLNKELTQIEKQKRHLHHEKCLLELKISKKHRYLNVLTKQLNNDVQQSNSPEP